MPRKKFALKKNDKAEILRIKRSGDMSCTTLYRLLILLALDSQHDVTSIAGFLRLSNVTVTRVKALYAAKGLRGVLSDSPNPWGGKKFGEEFRLLLLMLADTPPPEGKKRWTVRLLSEEIKRRFRIDISHETVRKILMQNAPKPRKPRK
ncbi:MAG: helix-turn-helix domain-containing protein [Deltaproteobacteria bacterium]|nr:helix-turn-helix domain-containing protein [Deltaproteobacteria bacterium]